MKVPNELRIVMSALMIVIILMILLYLGTEFGFTAAMIDDFAMLIPGLIFFVIGAFILSLTGTGMFALPAFSVVGMGLAMLAGEMNTLGVLIPDILTATFTIADLQLVIIIFFLLMGGISTTLGRRLRW